MKYRLILALSFLVLVSCSGNRRYRLSYSRADKSERAVARQAVTIQEIPQSLPAPGIPGHAPAKRPVAPLACQAKGPLPGSSRSSENIIKSQQHLGPDNQDSIPAKKTVKPLPEEKKKKITWEEVVGYFLAGLVLAFIIALPFLIIYLIIKFPIASLAVTGTLLLTVLLVVLSLLFVLLLMFLLLRLLRWVFRPVKAKK